MSEELNEINEETPVVETPVVEKPRKKQKPTSTVVDTTDDVSAIEVQEVVTNQPPRVIVSAPTPRREINPRVDYSKLPSFSYKFGKK